VTAYKSVFSLRSYTEKASFLFNFLNMKVSAVLCVDVVSCCIIQVCGWGAEGHSITADIAASLLTPKAAAGVDKYIPGKTMQSVASNADTYDHSTDGKWSAPAHYVDLNRDQTAYNASINCKTYCVVGSVLNYTERLQKNYSSIVYSDLATTEPNSIEFIVHYVGDIHQPLHVSWADDAGGNNVKVQFYGVSTNLHSVWDTSIISRYNSDWSKLSAELKNTIKSDPTLQTKYTKDMHPESWANESFGYTRNDVYDGVSGSNPNLTDDYYNHNLPIIKQRLIAGGIRLAALLNSIFV